MQKKFFPPPLEVVQRAQCYLALRLLRAYVDVMGKTRERRFDEHMDKIRRWLGECEGMLERRPVSSRTDTEVIAKLETVLSRINCGPEKTPQEQYTIGGRPSSAPTFFLWISGLPARNGITSLSAERMNQVLLPIVILGIIFTLLLTILRKGWSPIYPQE